MKDIYLYDDINVLRNKLNIRNSGDLERAEADITYIKLLDIDKIAIKGQLDLPHIQLVHKYIFGDIYEWAGEIRILNIEKAESVLSGLSVEYSDYSLIENDVNRVLNYMNNLDWLSLERSDLVDIFVKNTASLWRIHPFREGNTRSIITFMIQFAQRNGFKINKELLIKHSSYVRKALVLASIDEYSEIKYLKKIIDEALDI